MTSCDDVASCCVITKILVYTECLFVCTGLSDCIDVDAPPSLLTPALEPLHVPLPKLEVLPPLPAMLWTPLPVLVPKLC